MSITVQTDETCYRLVSDDGEESATVDYGEPTILVCGDGMFYCQAGADDETPAVFKVTDQEPASDVSVEEVEFDGIEDDEEEEEEEEEEEPVE